MSRRRILIIGGSDAGTSAALTARSTDQDCQIDVLLEDRFPNYSICGLPFLLSGEVADWRSLAHRQESEFGEQRISLHKESHAVAVDPGSHELTARGTDGERRFGYDRRRPSWTSTSATRLRSAAPGTPWQVAARAWLDGKPASFSTRRRP